MQTLRQVLRGILLALISLVLLFGGISLSLAEGNMTAIVQVPTSTLPLPPTVTPTWQPFITPAASDTPLPPTLTPTLPPPPINCLPPAGWLPYYTQAGDTLDSIALSYRVGSAELGQANCLLTTGLLPGVIIYVPPVPTPTPVPCGPPRNWIPYIVQAGDTLYHISHNYAVTVTVADLQRANCLVTSTRLHIGQTLYVPPWSTITPTITQTATPTLTPTKTPVTPTLTATITLTPTPVTPTVTETPVPATVTETPVTPVP